MLSEVSAERVANVCPASPPQRRNVVIELSMQRATE